MVVHGRRRAGAARGACRMAPCGGGGRCRGAASTVAPLTEPRSGSAARSVDGGESEAALRRGGGGGGGGGRVPRRFARRRHERGRCSGAGGGSATSRAAGHAWWVGWCGGQVETGAVAPLAAGAGRPGRGGHVGWRRAAGGGRRSGGAAGNVATWPHVRQNRAARIRGERFGMAWRGGGGGGGGRRVMRAVRGRRPGRRRLAGREGWGRKGGRGG